ncbi:hypothetical protein AACT_1882 [Arcobacter acticola]|uniref:Uncharacterized protein n=1 Tax=Arcobacter acticola TaxID=1849015 RepID=A0A6M8EEQ6_9BACT|nr:hypothetical protein [Arcobacter acticola]QKE29030.1 hypothetical protein AACT_1882 [Arcobacter acticola]
MGNKIDLNRMSELLSKECGLDKNNFWENSEKFKIMEIEMKDEFDTFAKNPLTKEISYKDKQSYMNDSFMYKIMKNQEMITKEEFLSLFKEEDEIFEQIVEKINFQEFQNVKTLLLNCISANEKVLIDFYANGFLDDLNKFNEESNIHLANIIIKDINKIFFNLIYQKN